MARIFDMSSRKIQSETKTAPRVTEYPDSPELGPALQEVCEIPETVTRDDASQQHIRELLKKL